ncbi:MAG: branched-chain amino acid ABC transporter permease [Clostridiales Family XIII bacterium]|jgi:branched-chain amino acid transport system permease protein|nr:branched-chain amino acid ABC transporter permease [Clostridiales Family XIII bacterium]
MNKQDEKLPGAAPTVGGKKNFLEGKLFLLIFAVVFAVLPLGMASFTQHILVLVLFYAFCASAWNILCGYIGVLSLGHSALMGIGAYTSTLLLVHFGVTPWVGMFIGALLTGVVGVLIGFPCFRMSGPYFTLTTIAFAELIRVYLENTKEVFGLDTKGASGITVPYTGDDIAMFSFLGKIPFYYLMLIFLVVILLITWKIDRSKLGYYFVAIRSDADAAESLGIKLLKYKLIGMFISAFFIAIAGAFYAQFFRYINPTRIFGLDMSIRIALIAVVGGQGKIFGPMIGAVILVPITELLSLYFGATLPGLHLFIYGVVMVIVVLFMPKGINDYVMRLFAWLEGLLLGKGRKAKESAQTDD